MKTAFSIIFILVVTLCTWTATAQSISLHKRNMYIQTISSLMSSDFTNRQQLLIAKDSLWIAEQSYTSMRIEQREDITANLLFSLASFHHFILNKPESAVKIAAIGQTLLKPTEVTPSIYKILQPLTSDSVSLFIRSAVFQERMAGIELKTRLWKVLCDLIGVYCPPDCTYVERQLGVGLQTSEYFYLQNSSAQQHNRLKKDNEQLYFDAIHLDFIGLFNRNAVDMAIDFRRLKLSVDRVNDKKGLFVKVEVNIPPSVSEAKRHDMIRAIFNCFLSTLQIYNNRFNSNLKDSSIAVIITANNIDLGVAAQNSKLFAQAGVTNIDFNMDYHNTENVYSIELTASTIFLAYHRQLMD